ncbi:hypothetical protein TNCV_3991041 [Trichonephila clavipes]|uniref:Uncharacterized protein n=1 Tax=Trichonephila clavipes TaxID=2585209 RepID=A0A8X6T141_TRICX|nr:hypothetical protein TNCV_3991041 [Trichonephila clavipes]
MSTMGNLTYAENAHMNYMYDLAQIVTAELLYKCITRSILFDECQITERFSYCIVNFVNHVHFSSTDMILVDEELYGPILD